MGGDAAAAPRSRGRPPLPLFPAPTQPTNAFGAPSAGGFGAAATPAFGAAPAQNAFGGGGGFGALSPSPFGAAAPAASPFGAPAPAAGGAFGGTSAFGAAAPSSNPFGGAGGGAAASPFGAPKPLGAFGAPAPAFGGTGSAFGGGGGGGAFGAAAAASPFGAPAASSPFGAPAASSPFGAPAAPAAPSPYGSLSGGMFGAHQQQQQQAAAPGSGSRAVAYAKTQDADASSTGGAKTVVFFDTIVAQPPYANRSVEELRWEDYAAGVKGSATAAGPAAALLSSGFGAAPATGGLFGAAGTQSAFGGGGGAFGAAPTPGAFGAAPTSAFGAAPSPSLFGAPPPSPSPFGGGLTTPPATPSLFGGGANAAPSAFGATPGGGLFGGASTPAFGAPASAAPSPLGGGGFGVTPSLFGGGGGFGATPSAPSFSTPGLFGAAPPASAAPAAGGFAFGGTPASTAPTLGGGLFGAPASAAPAPGGGLFGAPASSAAPAFGGGGLFGAPAPSAAPAAGGLFGAPAPAAGGLFGAPAPATGGLFGAPAPALAGGGLGLFGAPAPAPGGGLFGAPATSAAPAFGGGIFGAAPAPGTLALAPLATAPPSGPYGALPPAPAVEAGLTMPDCARTGLAARTPSAGASGRPAALLAARGAAGAGARLGARLRAPGAHPSPSPAPSPASGTTPAGPGGTLAPRDDPRAFFVRTPLPTAAPPSPAGDGSPPPAPANGKPGAGGSPGAAPAVPDLPTPPTADGAFMEPSMGELARAAAADPTYLSHVRGFVVGVTGVGSVRWLDPVDVRSADLPRVVRLAPGAVEVYPEDDESKPDVGHGLNGRAQVTLEGVFKLDRATGDPVADPAAIDRFAKKLRRLAADQGAKFVGYDADGGVWRFEVDHFSRYGLAALDSDSDDESAGALAKPAPIDAAAAPPAGDAGDGMDGAASDGDATVPPSARSSPPSDAAPAAAFDGRSLRALAAASPELLVALPARLGLDPSDVASARDALFGAGGGDGAREAPPPVDFDMTRKEVAVPSLALALAGAAPRKRPSPGPDPSPRGPPRSSSLNAWDSDGAALLPPAPLGPARPTPAPLPASPFSPASARALAAPLSPGAEPAGGEARLIVDAGAVLGRSFRVGWGPGGVMAAPRAGGRVELTRVPLRAALLPPSGGDAAPLRARWAARWTASLAALARHCEPIPGSGGPFPRLRARVRRDGELRALVVALLTAATESAATIDGGDPASTPEGAALAGEAAAWELVDALWSTVDGDAGDPAAPPLAPPLGPPAPGADDDGAAKASSLRRAALSRWLRDRCAADVAAALDAAPAASPDRVAALLAGGRTADAVAAAVRGGDVRLAALIPAAAADPAARREAAAAVARWDADGTAARIAPGRLLAYRLLAGDVDGAAPDAARSWRAALGLHLWHGVAPGAAPAAALAAYEASAAAGAAPPPAPAYAATGAPPRAPPPTARTPAPAPDACLRLLQLAARGAPPDAAAGALAALAAPAGITPDPLDALPGWSLALVARAVGALPEGALDTPPAAEAALHCAAAAALEAAGAPEWAALPLLCIPDGACGASGGAARAAAVTELLERHAAVWTARPGAAATLTDTLGVPAAALAAASALHARATHDPDAEFEARVAAGDWGGAHALLAGALAPARLARGGERALQELRAALVSLAPHAAEVDASSGAGSWRAGAGVYALFLELSADDAAPLRARLPPGDRAARVRALCEGLSAAAARPPPARAPAAAATALGDVASAAARWALAAAHAGGASLVDAGAVALALPQLRSDDRAAAVAAAASAVAEAVGVAG